MQAKTLRVELEGAWAPPGKEERNTRCPGSAACPAPRSRAAPSLCAQRDAGMAFAAATKSGPGLLLRRRKRRRSGDINPTRTELPAAAALGTRPWRLG